MLFVKPIKSAERGIIEIHIRVTSCGHKQDKLSLWLQALIERRGFNKAAVALANKNARILWAMGMATQEREYDALRVQPK